MIELPTYDQVIAEVLPILQPGDTHYLETYGEFHNKAVVIVAYWRSPSALWLEASQEWSETHGPAAEGVAEGEEPTSNQSWLGFSRDVRWSNKKA